jgi:hypothetical protein
LKVVAFVIGVVAFGILAVLPIAAHREHLAPVLAVHWHLAVVGYAEAVMVLSGFLLLAILGLA